MTGNQTREYLLIIRFPYKEKWPGFPGMASTVMHQMKMLGRGWKRIHEEWEVCTEKINPHWWHQALYSPPVYLIIEDRDHITLDSVTHSERGRSMRHCMVTDVIWEDYGQYTVRWLWYFLLLHTRCSIFWHVVTKIPEELLSCPAGYTSELLLAAAWRSGRGSVCLDSHLSVFLRYTRKAWSEAPPCSLLSFTHRQTQLLLWQGGCTLAFTKQPWHASLPDSTSPPSLETDRQAELSWEQTVVDCLTNTPSHQQDKVEETGAEHM